MVGAASRHLSVLISEAGPLSRRQAASPQHVHRHGYVLGGFKPCTTLMMMMGLIPPAEAAAEQPVPGTGTHRDSRWLGPTTQRHPEHPPLPQVKQARRSTPPTPACSVPTQAGSGASPGAARPVSPQPCGSRPFETPGAPARTRGLPPKMPPLCFASRKITGPFSWPSHGCRCEISGFLFGVLFAHPQSERGTLERTARPRRALGQPGFARVGMGGRLVRVLPCTPGVGQAAPSPGRGVGRLQRLSAAPRPWQPSGDTRADLSRSRMVQKKPSNRLVSIATSQPGEV